MVIVTWDPSHPGFWLSDYFPDTLSADRKIFPTLREGRPCALTSMKRR